MRPGSIFLIFMHTESVQRGLCSALSFEKNPINLISRCRTNCGRKRRFSGVILYRTRCYSTCQTKFGGMEYTWRLYALDSTTNNSVEITNFEELTLTGKYLCSTCNDMHSYLLVQVRMTGLFFHFK